jgi:hypothetical protein
MKTTFKLHYELNSTILKNGVTKDDLRPVMKNVYFDSIAEKLVITDGFKIVCYPVEITDGESKYDGLIPLQAFDVKFLATYFGQKKLSSMSLEYEITSEFCNVWYGSNCYAIKLEIGSYPRWKSAFPSEVGAENNKIENIGISFDLLSECCECLPKDERKQIKLSFTKKTGGILFQTAKKQHYTSIIATPKETHIYGLIMPVMLTDGYKGEILHSEYRKPE